MTGKTRKKVLRKKPAPKGDAPQRKDHPVAFRLSAQDLIAVQEGIKRLNAASGMEITLASYAKHATLSLEKLRAMEVRLRGQLALFPRDDEAGLDNELKAMARDDLEAMARGIREALNYILGPQ